MGEGSGENAGDGGRGGGCGVGKGVGRGLKTSFFMPSIINSFLKRHGSDPYSVHLALQTPEEKAKKNNPRICSRSETHSGYIVSPVKR